jgi:pyruvate dehydrogenase E2 component (dihydrolipoyllysine-residue acetyltransferase)
VPDIVMPQLGETVTEGTITKWFKQVGEQVAQDEVLFEVSTDKVDSEVPSAAAGFVVEIRVPEGETVDVGTVLAVVGDAPGAAAAGGGTTQSASPAPAATPAPEAPAPAGDGQGAAPSPAPSVEQAPAPDAAPAPPASPPEPAVASADASDGNGAGASEGRLLSPIVRRLVNDHGLDVSRIQGTGPGGRVTRSDVERAIDAGGAAAAPAAAPSAPSGPAPTAPAPPAPAPAPAAAAPAAARSPAPSAPVTLGHGDTSVPLNRIRRITGEHMVMSKATSPHVLTAMEVDFEGVEQVRRAIGGKWREEEGSTLTYLPFIARATCDAIRDFPYINASLGEGELIIHGSVNLGIAVDLNFEGLVAPVVRGADGKRLRAIAREIVDLATRARSRRLNPDDLSGGTFTLTNPGQYGTMMQFPIINQPQVAILSTDGVKRKPVVVTDAFGNETIGIHSVGILALAWDHRAFDGAYAAAFLARLRDIIETRNWADEAL